MAAPMNPNHVPPNAHPANVDPPMQPGHVKTPMPKKQGDYPVPNGDTPSKPKRTKQTPAK